jgi:putative DNA primase/helicase
MTRKQNTVPSQDQPAEGTSVLAGFDGEVRKKLVDDYALDHQGAAQLFIDTFGHEIRWVQAERTWYIASRTARPGYWSREDREGAMARMLAVCRVMADNHSSSRPKTVRFAEDSLKVVRASLTARTTDFDPEPLRLGVLNGVVDLRSGILRPVTPKDMLTRSTGVPFDPNAECPSWQEHLRVMTRVDDDRDAPGDPELASYIQELVGLSLIGEQREHCFVYLHGYGRNGKGVFIDTLRAVLGDHADVLDQTVLFAKSDAHTTGLHDLAGKRFVTADEITGTQKINTALLKRLTGGGTIKARRMRQDNVTFKPSFTFWLVSNHEPNFGLDESIGLWSRVLVLETGPTVPEHQRVPDSDLRGSLLAEGSGILNWAVDGAMRYLQRGKMPPMPHRVRAAIEALASEARLTRRFLDEKYEPDPGGRVLFANMRESFEEWLKHEGELDRFGTLSGKHFGSLLRAERIDVRKGPQHSTYVFGLRPRTAVTDSITDVPSQPTF